jgi:hypothetical protein
MTKPPETKPVRVDDELLILGRIERMLGKLPSEEAKARVLTYLVSRHQNYYGTMSCGAPPNVANPFAPKEKP